MPDWVKTTCERHLDRLRHESQLDLEVERSTFANRAPCYTRLALLMVNIAVSEQYADPPFQGVVSSSSLVFAWVGNKWDGS